MAFCPNCGAEVTGAFCPNCGTQVAGATTGTTGTGYTTGTTGTSYTPPIPTAGGLTENVASALCYLFGLVTGIIFLLIAPYSQNKTVRFHAFQAIFGHIAIIVIWIGLSIVGGIIAVASRGFVGLFFFPLFWLLVFILWLYMMFSAYNNRKVKLPLVGDLAAKQA